MTPTATRHSTSVPTCEAVTAMVPGLYGLEPLRCRGKVGLRFIDGHAYCSKHREAVAAQVRRMAAR